eukprot:356766-Chlamydomonas_euryale.AAC.1
MDTSLDVDNSTTAFNGVRTEGQAFYRIIGPMLEEADSTCDSLMRSIYGLGSASLPSRTEGKYYCRALACIPDAFGISSAELGVLEGTNGYCVGTSLITPAGNVGPLANDVSQQAGLSKTVSQIKDAMRAGNFGNAQSIYNSDSYLTGLAQGNGLSGSTFSKFSDYFGSDDFNAQYITKGFNEPNAAAKGDMVEKTVQDAIPVQAIWSLIAGTDAENWEQAAALYIGAESGDSPYGRANLRSRNFGTNGETGEATTNENIVAAFDDGPSAANRDTIIKNLKITYTQATLRYAFFIDRALTAADQNTTGAFEYRAEGDAFYRIIAPFVEEVDAGCNAFLSAVLSVDAGENFPSPE